jgi:DNA-directed RNA polymerase I subunit RPA1
MTLPVAEHLSAEDIEAFCKTASRLTLSQVVDNVTIEETLITEDGVRMRNFAVVIQFFPSDHYQEEYRTTPYRVLVTLGVPFGLILKRELMVELKKLNADLKGQIKNVGKGQAAPRAETRATEGEGEEEDRGADGGEPDEAQTNAGLRDDISEAGDGDADDVKRARQTRQLSYESDSEDEADEELATRDEQIDGEGAVSAEESTSNKSKSILQLSRAVDKELCTSCGAVVPGSFVFEYKETSLCKFDLSVRFLVCALY